MLVHQDLARTCAERPDHMAIVTAHERCTYRELAARARGVAHALLQCGTARGGRVALFLDNGVDFVAGVYGALSIGAVFVPINPLTKRDKLIHILNDTRASALLTQASLNAVWAPAIAAAPTSRAIFVTGNAPTCAWPAASDSPIPPAVTIDVDLAAIIYTSGSTGAPKGVMLTHSNMLSAERSVITYLGLRGDDRIMCAMPLAFSYGLYHVLMACRVGATVVLERTFAFPVKVLEAMARERVTVFPGVPTMFSMLTALKDISPFDLSALRIITSAGAALTETQITRVRQCFPQAALYVMHGLTECKRVTYLPPEQLDTRPTSVGRGMPNTEVWLVDDQGQRLPNGSIGELVVRGSHVMAGYWEQPHATAERLRPGPVPGERVLHTGDIFRSDDEGWLYFVSRSDDIIKSRGEKISPREVENAISALEGVSEVAVVGVDDELLGQAIKAYVKLELNASLSERDVIRHCQSRLESFMVPKVVAFVENLPRTDNGKINKAALRAKIQTQGEVQ